MTKKTELQTREKTSPAEAAQQSGPVALMRMIEAASINPDVDVEKLERMWAMYDAERKRIAEQEFNAALGRMQAAMPAIREGGAIKHSGKVISTYGRWDEDILPVIKPILQDHGFGLSFRVNTDSNVRVEAVLSHEAGHSAHTAISLPADVSGSKNPVQAVASSVSYGKRYTAGSLLNLEIHGQDTDGNMPPNADMITDDQREQITHGCEIVGEKIESVCKRAGVNTLDDLTAERAARAIAWLNRKADKRSAK